MWVVLGALVFAGTGACDGEADDTSSPDADRDGYTVAGGDCDDGDPDVHPDATEVCNGVDDDCANGVDDGATTVFFYDDDHDGYGVDDPETNHEGCEAPAGFATEAGDCDDDDPAAFPGNPEVCDGVDNDCLNGVDDGVLTTFYFDDDEDAYGVDDPMTNQEGCEAHPDYVTEAGDCDDGDAAVHPGATEVCNEIDDDCAGGVDDGVTTTYYLDDDGDEYGVDDPETNVEACAPPADYVAVAGDCDDDEPAAFPENPEVCDGIDNDCLNGPDDGVTPNTYYQDDDEDGWGDDEVTQQGCVTPTPGTWVLQGSDCDDGATDVNPDAIEICDGIDNNCLYDIDEGPIAVWPDADEDGFGDRDGIPTYWCDVQPFTASNDWDCDDTDPDVHPEGLEIPGNETDENCDGSDGTEGIECGEDSVSVTALPYRYRGVLDALDPTTDGPRGDGYAWDDVEITASAGDSFTVLYGSPDTAALEPYLFVYGPDSCTLEVGHRYGTANGTDRGGYLAYVKVPDAEAGYYSAVATTHDAGHLGAYLFDVLPGNVGGSCGEDMFINWPLGWRSDGTLEPYDTPSGTPVPTGYYADDFEFFLEAGTTYSLLLARTNYSEKIVLASAEDCATQIGASTMGITNGGARLVYTPAASGVYVAYVTSTTGATTGSYTFDVIEGDLGKECFEGAGSNGGTGDNYALYPLGGSTTNSLSTADRGGDFGSRVFDDYETFLEAGEQIEVSMTVPWGEFRPAIYLTRPPYCATKVAEAVGTTTQVTLEYTAVAPGIYTLVFTSAEPDATGPYSLSHHLQ